MAAIGFAFGGSAAWRIQHTGQILSLGYFPLAFWLLIRALERASRRLRLRAGVVAGIMVLGRDQVAWLGVYVLAGCVVWHGRAPPDNVLAALRASFVAARGWRLGGILVAACR